MSYKIAIASNDGVYVNAHFGSSLSFHIIEVNDDGSYVFKEERIVSDIAEQKNNVTSCENRNDSINSCSNNLCENNSKCGHKIIPSSEIERKSSCNTDSCYSCGGGHSDAKIEQRVSLISDCRCLLCKKIGPSAERMLGRKAISTFAIDYKIDDALAKIIDYYTKMDNHISLRKR